MGRFSRMFRAKQGIRTKNHYETTMAATTATELQTAIGIGIDAPANRSSNIVEGSILKSVVCALQAQSATAGKYQCLMLFRGGATTFANPIASYFSTTDPITEEAIQIRRDLMGRVHTRRLVTGALVPATFVCKWKGSKVMRDGDDIIIDLLQDTGGTVTFDAQVWLTYIM